MQGKVAAEFIDTGEQELKNIARPVRVYRVGARPAERPDALFRPSLPLPDKPSIAVLPFVNLSSDPEQEFLADGVAEDIIFALSRYPSLFVIARNSSFTYRGRAVDVKAVGRELGVRYVLEGSLRKAGSRVRVTGQLVEAETGKHLRAERYDRDLADIFALQDEISERVTIAVSPAVDEAERQRAMRKPPQNLDAWTAYQRGLWHYEKCTAEDNRLAEQFFQQAIDLDPTFAGGYTGLALVLATAAKVFGPARLPEAQSSGEGVARRAVALDPANAGAHTCLSEALSTRGDLDGALAEAERALARCPNFAQAHAEKGWVLIISGKPKDGIVALETALRLDPRGRRRGFTEHYIAIGHYFCREYEAAVEAAKRAIHSLPDYPNPHRFAAMALGQLGRTEEAKEALQKTIAIAPAGFDLYVRTRLPWYLPEQWAHLLEGLRKAGWQG